MENLDKASNFLDRVDGGPRSPNAVDRRMVTLTAPASAAAEQYRTLYYRIERLRDLKTLKVVALTSAVPGEGKTLTAVNLALTAARANPDRRVLLVDADMRRGQVASCLGIRFWPGLAELLADECQASDAVRRFKSTRLMVMPSGKPPEEPTQMLASARMRQLLKALREGFEEIYVDLPPALPFADASILGAQADGVVVVVRANVTSQKNVRLALEHLKGMPFIGCVLNGAQPDAAPYLKLY